VLCFQVRTQRGIYTHTHTHTPSPSAVWVTLFNKQAAGRALLNRIVCILLEPFGYSNFVSSLVESWIILIHFWLRVIFVRVHLNIRFFLGFIG
jgi:hypothetical protein